MEGVHCNCELGEALDMAPNLISHHLSVLRKAGLVEVERDAFDARWIYYSLNRQALAELNTAFGSLLDPARIKPRGPPVVRRARSSVRMRFSSRKTDFAQTPFFYPSTSTEIELSCLTPLP
jgi:DNA-binding transcriptional ArsR family regulator